MPQILTLIFQAIAEVKAAQAEAQLAWVAESGNLILLVEFYPDGIFGSFADETYHCWDGCGGVARFHRSGWCRFHPEHADFDCNCNYAEAEAEYYASLEAEEQYSDEAVAAVMVEDRDALDALDSTNYYEPF